MTVLLYVYVMAPSTAIILSAAFITRFVARLSLDYDIYRVKYHEMKKLVEDKLSSKHYPATEWVSSLFLIVTHNEEDAGKEPTLLNYDHLVSSYKMAIEEFYFLLAK